jgi:hypothetical protein
VAAGSKRAGGRRGGLRCGRRSDASQLSPSNKNASDNFFPSPEGVAYRAMLSQKSGAPDFSISADAGQRHERKKMMHTTPKLRSGSKYKVLNSVPRGVARNPKSLAHDHKICRSALCYGLTVGRLSELAAARLDVCCGWGIL